MSKIERLYLYCNLDGNWFVNMKEKPHGIIMVFDSSTLIGSGDVDQYIFKDLAARFQKEHMGLMVVLTNIEKAKQNGVDVGALKKKIRDTLNIENEDFVVAVELINKGNEDSLDWKPNALVLLHMLYQCCKQVDQYYKVQ